MNPAQIIHNQLSLVAEVTRNERHYESERRGCYVAADDPIVQARVFAIAMDHGAEWRKRTEERGA